MLMVPWVLTAARITSDGTLLDPLGFSISESTQDAAWMAPPEVLFTAARGLARSDESCRLHEVLHAHRALRRRDPRPRRRAVR